MGRTSGNIRDICLCLIFTSSISCTPAGVPGAHLPHPGLLNGSRFLKRTNPVFTLERSFDEALLVWHIFSECLFCVPGTDAKILGISDILRMQILEIYTLTLPSIFLSIALLALEYT